MLLKKWNMNLSILHYCVTQEMDSDGETETEKCQGNCPSSHNSS